MTKTESRPESELSEAIVFLDVGLPDDVEQSLRELASQHGLSTNGMVAHLIRNHAALTAATALAGEREARVVSLHAKIKNTRRDLHHKAARSLVDRYGLIAAESLNIQGMMRNRRLSRRIADAAWFSFIQILTSKAASAGCQVVLVDPRGTSQECSQCGGTVPKDLSVRVHECACGCVLDRDVNAARNILGRAVPGGVNAGNSLHCPESRYRLLPSAK